MRIFLTKAQVWLVLESLAYTEARFSEYERYPSEKFKQEQLQKVQEVIDRILEYEKGRGQ